MEEIEIQEKRDREYLKNLDKLYGVQRSRHSIGDVYYSVGGGFSPYPKVMAPINYDGKDKVIVPSKYEQNKKSAIKIKL